MTNYIEETYGNKVRVRVCGLLYYDESLLLIKHNLDGKTLWGPPGGEPIFGESLTETLTREFKEETYLDIEPGEFLFLTEHINPPLHAIELFYKINSYRGIPRVGSDPELPRVKTLVEVAFVDESKLAAISTESRHAILKNCTNPIQLLDKRGYLK